MKRRKILAITSGGTIGSLLETESISINQEGETALTQKLRDLENKLGVNLDIHNAANVASGSFEPEDWVRFANIIKDAQETGVDRFLITHGTDTLHYTAAFLALQFGRRPLKICVTGAFFPNNHHRSDGAQNLACALDAVTSNSIENGTYVCFPQSVGVTPALAVMAPDHDETQYRTLYSQSLSKDETKLRASNLAELILKDDIPFIDTHQFHKARNEVFFARLYPGIDMRVYDRIPMNSILVIEGFHSGTASSRDGDHTLLELRSARSDLTICLGSIPSPVVETPYEVSNLLAMRGIWVYKDIPPYVLFVAALIGKALGSTNKETFERFESLRIARS